MPLCWASQRRRRALWKQTLGATSGIGRRWAHSPTTPAGETAAPFSSFEPRTISKDIKFFGKATSHPCEQWRLEHCARVRGRPAVSGYVVLERLAGGGAALTAWRLRTGRTHQIRVHARHIGHPLLADGQYGGAGGSALAAIGRSKSARRALPLPSILTGVQVFVWRTLCRDSKLLDALPRDRAGAGLEKHARRVWVAESGACGGTCAIPLQGPSQRACVCALVVTGDAECAAGRWWCTKC